MDDKSKDVVNPFIEGGSCILEKNISTATIVEAYHQSLKIDVSSYFDALDSIQLYRCEISGFRFFFPTSISGDGKFYELLQSFDWYYMAWKWEHESSLQYVKPGMNILEVGCAHGTFLNKVSKIAGKVVGLELNEKAVKQGVESKIDIRNESIEKHAEKNVACYDLVCSFQVLEHVSNVRSFLDSQLKTLQSGGYLVISVPNNGGFLGDSFNVLNLPPHHMGLWNENSLLSLKKIYNLEHVATHFEPLQKYHEKYFLDVLKEKFQKTRIPFLQSLAHKKVFRNLFFNRRYTAFTIQVVFKKK